MTFSTEKGVQAERDIEEIFVYIGQDNIDAATRFLIAVETSIELLATQPFAGFERSFENAELNVVLRFWPVKGFNNYLIAYQPVADKNLVKVVRVLNTYRDFNLIFAR